MGTYSKGILGPFSGKVGTVVGSTWNGIDYMRSLPKPSTKAPTDAQLVQRVKLAFGTGFLRPISPLLSIGFKSLAIKQSGFNVATALVVKNAITGTYPDFEIDYSKVLFSTGNLTDAWNATVSSAAPNAVTFTWTNNSGSGNGKETDMAVLLVYNPSRSQFVYITNGAQRSSATETLIVPDSFSGETVETWMAFLSADKKMISTSVYVGPLTIV